MGQPRSMVGCVVVVAWCEGRQYPAAHTELLQVPATPLLKLLFPALLLWVYVGMVGLMIFESL